MFLTLTLASLVSNVSVESVWNPFRRKSQSIPKESSAPTGFTSDPSGHDGTSVGLGIWLSLVGSAFPGVSPSDVFYPRQARAIIVIKATARLLFNMFTY